MRPYLLDYPHMGLISPIRPRWPECSPWPCLLYSLDLGVVAHDGGGKPRIIGLAPVDKELFKDSHPITYKCCEVAQGDNDRYLLGRQFMVVVIFYLRWPLRMPRSGDSLTCLPTCSWVLGWP
jgi:hypothetical protein